MPLPYFIPAKGFFNFTGLADPTANRDLEASNVLPTNDPKRGELILSSLVAHQATGTVLPLALPNMYFGMRSGLTPTFTNYWWQERWDREIKAG
jgi:hypothetical protein